MVDIRGKTGWERERKYLHDGMEIFLHAVIFFRRVRLWMPRRIAYQFSYYPMLSTPILERSFPKYVT